MLFLQRNYKQIAFVNVIIQFFFFFFFFVCFRVLFKMDKLIAEHAEAESETVTKSQSAPNIVVSFPLFHLNTQLSS